MKKALLLLLSVFISICSIAQQSDPPIGDFKTKLGQQVPGFSFETEKGIKARISDYKGKYVLLNFFATWCPPCNQELPLAQEQIWNKHKDNPKFAFIVFGREEGWAKLDSFKLKKGFTFPLVPDLDRSIFSLFAPNGIPRNVVIDPNGKIIYQSFGYTAEEFTKLVQLIDSKL